MTDLNLQIVIWQKKFALSANARITIYNSSLDSVKCFHKHDKNDFSLLEFQNKPLVLAQHSKQGEREKEKQFMSSSVNEISQAAIIENCRYQSFAASIVWTYLFRLGHVGNDSIGNDEQNKILRTVNKFSRNSCHVINSGGEISWTIQLNTTDATFVS